MSKLSVIFCGYRDWATDVIEKVRNHPRIREHRVFTDNPSFLEAFANPSFQPDIIVFLGWSWIIPASITEKYLCLGIHPSDLPEFRGGSPIQNQIVRGITDTRCSLFRLTEKLDAGEVWLKTDLSLAGDNITAIFKHIAEASVRLLTELFDKYPDITPQQQDVKAGSIYKRRKEEQSRLTPEDISRMSLRELYDFIRCLTDPYPNAYLEDEQGNRLYLTGVRYEKSGKTGA
jgi:methionyl-tRNA formyltransferase